ncbi:MAG: uncharacterized protein KVP18_004741 [Porospora cf. gigantea A]|nr:MAG: hypothetical protein KVP18_004741 [Porospora cf. gigantea A]
MLKQAVVGEPPIGGLETRPLKERFQALKPGFKGYIDLVVANRRDVQVTITVEPGLTALNRNNESTSEPYSDVCTLKIVQPKLSFDLLPGSENDALSLEPTGNAWGIVAKQDSAVMLRVPAEARMTLANDNARCCLPMHITFNETMSSTIYPILSLGLFGV